MNQLARYLYQEEIYDARPSVIVVVKRPWHKILDDEKALLSKILGSVKLSLEGVTIIHREEVSAEGLSAFDPGKVLIFGAPVEGDIKPYERAVIGNYEVIKADDLGELDDAKKKSLWLALKQMFSV